MIKLGDCEEMRSERTAHGRIQEILGNNAPLISDFAELGDRGGIKNRYASMSGTAASTTFQDHYQEGMSLGAAFFTFGLSKAAEAVFDWSTRKDIACEIAVEN